MEKYIVIIDLHCDPTIPSGAGDIGGGNTYSRSLLVGLQKTSYKHIFITRKKYPFLDEYIKMSSISDFYRIDLGDFGPIDKDELQKYHVDAKNKINQILDHYHNCTFIFHSSYWQSGNLAYELALQYNTFYVHTILSNAKRKKLSGAIDDIVVGRIEVEEKIFRNARYLFCSSLSELNDMVALYNIPEERLLFTGLQVDDAYAFPAYNQRGEISINSVNNPFVDKQYLSYYNPASDQDDYLWWNNKSFIYFGRIHKNKGISEIIQAWYLLYKILGKNTPNLWIVGGAPSQIEHFRNSIKKDMPYMEMCEKEHKIIWWGTLPPSGISTLLLKSLVVLTHSKYEAGGLVLLEAFTQGLPVIATPNGYAKDYIQDWYNGFLVDYKDVHLLAKYMMFFCNQPFLSYYMGNNASQTMAAIKDSWDFMQSHLYAYGLVNSRNMTIYNPPQGDWYRKITTYSLESYPYQSNFPSETAVIKQLLKLAPSITIYRISQILDYSYDFFIWDITTDIGSYTMCLYYDIINCEHIWNAHSSEPMVLTKAERISNISFMADKDLLSPVLYKDSVSGIVIFKGRWNELFSIPLIDDFMFLTGENKTLDEKQALPFKIDRLLSMIEEEGNGIIEKESISNMLYSMSSVCKTIKNFDIGPAFSISQKTVYPNLEGTLQIAFDKIAWGYYDAFKAQYLINSLSTEMLLSITGLDKATLIWILYYKISSFIELSFIGQSFDRDQLFKSLTELYSRIVS